MNREWYVLKTSKDKMSKKKMSKGWVSVVFDCEDKYFILFHSRKKKKRCIGNEN